MFGGFRRLPRAACALAQRRHYLGVVLRGGDGPEAIAFKLCLPWEKHSLSKSYEEDERRFLRVLAPTSGGSKDNSRATLTLHEKSAVIASVELLPAAMEVDDEDGEGRMSPGMDCTSEDEWEEDDLYSSTEKGSGDRIMDLFNLGEAAERALAQAETDTESFEPVANRKSFHSTRPSSSSFIDLCIWPRDLFAYVTLLKTDAKGNSMWKASWSFDITLDSIMPDAHNTRRPMVAYSKYRDERLEFTGVICNAMFEKLQISFSTNYEVKEFLGSGGEAKVYRCLSLKNPHMCAVKWSSHNSKILGEPRESLIMKRIFHPNLKRMFCAWNEDTGKEVIDRHSSFFLAQELCKCTLETYLDGNPVKQDRVKIFVQIVSRVNYLHTKGIIHRDIKSSNIFLDDYGNVKIGDFGQSALASSYSCCCGGKFYGTKLYGSPEILKMQSHTEKTDIFSLGMVYAELFGPAVLATERREWLLELRRLIKSRQWKRSPFSTWERSELSKDWSGDAYLMMRMLDMTPEQRPCCPEILEVL